MSCSLHQWVSSCTNPSNLVHEWVIQCWQSMCQKEETIKHFNLWSSFVKRHITHWFHICLPPYVLNLLTLTLNLHRSNEQVGFCLEGERLFYRTLVFFNWTTFSNRRNVYFSSFNFAFQPPIPIEEHETLTRNIFLHKTTQKLVCHPS